MKKKIIIISILVVVVVAVVAKMILTGWFLDYVVSLLHLFNKHIRLRRAVYIIHTTTRIS